MSQLAPSGSTFPGKTLGVVGLVLSFFLTIPGSIVSFIAWRQSRAAGFENAPALIGVAIGVVVLGFWIAIIAVFTPLVGVALTR